MRVALDPAGRRPEPKLVAETHTVAHTVESRFAQNRADSGGGAGDENVRKVSEIPGATPSCLPERAGGELTVNQRVAGSSPASGAIKRRSRPLGVASSFLSLVSHEELEPCHPERSAEGAESKGESSIRSHKIRLCASQGLISFAPSTQSDMERS